MEDGKKRRIGILGGTFDPPTIGHIQMAAEAINLRYVDEVWVIPCGTRKDKDVGTPGDHRLKMTQMLVQDFFPPEFPVKVNDIEIRNGVTIPTYNLMQKLINDPANQNYEFYFILGSDLLENLRRWDYGDKLMEEINFIIFIRIGYILRKETLPKNYIIVHTTFVASSSTEIRNRIRALRNRGTLDVNHPKLPRKSSSDQNQSFSKVYEINVSEDQLNTLESMEDEEKRDDERKKLEDKYLGIYGIVPASIIKYIKDNDLYLDKPQNGNK